MRAIALVVIVVTVNINIGRGDYHINNYDEIVLKRKLF